jgi:hypothetical protein
VFDEVRARLRMANHIRCLFAKRPETLGARRWNCTLRKKRLFVIRPSTKEPSDQVIMDCFLKSEQLPSWRSTYIAVRKNWNALVEANIDIPEKYNIWNHIP